MNYTPKVRLFWGVVHNDFSKNNLNWSERRESNSRSQLGRLELYH